MKVLVVSSYPPRHCGIGTYAAAQVALLRQGGADVTVLNPPDGDGNVRARFLGGGAFRRAARIGHRFDRIVVHFQPGLYYRPRAPLSKVATSLSLLRLCRRHPHTELVVHEADPPALWRPDYRLLAMAFRTAGRVWFHTHAERKALEESYGVRVKGELVPHTDGVRVAERLTRGEARRALRLPDGETLFVCAGFLHPDKGYEVAVRAFERLGSGRLFVVGSVRDAVPRNLAYASRLRDLCGGVPGAELREGYIDDREFDRWVSAADAMVFPYLRSWSSGALARAQLHGTPSIVASVGGLPEQVGVNDVVFETEDQLVEAMAAVDGRAAAARERESAPAVETERP